MDMKLRQSAEERLAKGSAPSSRGSPIGTKALALLHDLAGTPKTASEALKLLHELQVHQVELDLQQEQAEQECRQLSEDLSLYKALFDFAPFAYLSVDSEGLVIAANRIAAEWFAPGSGETQEWAGRSVEDLLAPECGIAFRGLLAAVRNGDHPPSCAVQSKANGATAQALATAAPGGRHTLLAFVPAGSQPPTAGL